MVRLAGLYFNATDGKGDPQQALVWYKNAAEKGDRDAFYQLGLLSEAGVATAIDFPSALKYYERSAQLGSQQGMLAAARMYQYGIGVKQDPKQAVVYYQMLAGLGNAFAQYQLASLYNSKALPEATAEEGKKWLQEALKNGSPQALQMLQKLAAQNQNQASFVEPAMFKQTIKLSGRPVELMYLDALNQWNCGDAIQSKQIFNRIRSEFPDYIPAKRTIERMSLG
jgi:enhanced entry protein EnhC